MSRLYRLEVVITADECKKLPQLCGLFENEFGFETEDDRLSERPEDFSLRLRGCITLCGGESEQTFAHRFARFCWEQAGKAKIGLYLTYLEEPPCESFKFSDEDYDEWRMRQSAAQPKKGF